MSLTDPDSAREALTTLRIRREDRRAVRGSGGGGGLVKPLLLVVLLGLLGIGGWFAWPLLGNLGGRDWIPDAVRARPEVRASKVVVEVGRAADAGVVGAG